MDLNPPDHTEGHLLAVDDKIKSLEESALALKLYRNTLVPISRLPTEILSIIFSLLPSPLASTHRILPVVSISHVCHQWREISLSLPHLWNHINFDQLTPDGVAEMFARAKMLPLHLEASLQIYQPEKFKAFEGQIKLHIHHTRHLTITIAGAPEDPERTFEQLTSPAPSLEQFSIARAGCDSVVIPDNLFNGFAPSLIYLRLHNCGIGWESPLLKGLQDLDIISFPSGAQTTLKTWLDALSQMSRLERLTLDYGVPINSIVRQPGLTVVLSSITELEISGIVLDCILVLSCLELPALARLRVRSRPYSPQNTSMLRLVPYFARNAHGPQDTEALQSLFIGTDLAHFNHRQKIAGIVAWTMPRGDTDGRLLGGTVDLCDSLRLARLAFSTILLEDDEVYTPLHDALLTSLPLNSITSLTVDGSIPLNKQLWRIHAPRWLKLERLRLFRTAVPAFREMLKEVPCGGPLLPSLEELVLVGIRLDAQKVYYLYDMLIELVEFEIPIRTLDLRSCTATNRAVKLLNEIVVDVQGPVKTSFDFELIRMFGEDSEEEDEE